MSEQPSIDPWLLSAPESLVLLWGPESGDVVPLQFGLLELVARGYLELGVEERRYLFGAITLTGCILTRPPGHWTAGTHALDSLLDTVPFSISGLPARRRLREVVETILRRQVTLRPLRRRSGTREVLTGRGWIWQAVLPALGVRGYYVPGEGVVRNQPETWKWELTPVGVAAVAHLMMLLRDGREQFEQWTSNDPGRAWDYLDRAGSAPLLISGLVPYVRRLAAADPERTQWELRRAADAASHPTRAGLVPPPAFPFAACLRTWPDGDLDSILELITEEVDKAWFRLQRGVGMGGSGE